MSGAGRSTVDVSKTLREALGVRHEERSAPVGEIAPARSTPSIDAGTHTELDYEPEPPSMNELLREAVYEKLHG